MSFDTDIRFWRSETAPAELLADIIAARPVNGASVIRSAVAKAIEELGDEGTPRSVLILLSDGVDLGSPVTETQMFRTIESANVGIYPVPFVASNFSSAPPASGRTLRAAAAPIRELPRARQPGRAELPHPPRGCLEVWWSRRGHGLSGALDR
jgi:hypothetical protein